MTTESFEWPILAIGTIGAEFEVLSPPELSAHMCEWIDRFGRAPRPR
jgi:hypothetical protein